jgi:hypothetical protein
MLKKNLRRWFPFSIDNTGQAPTLTLRRGYNWGATEPDPNLVQSSSITNSRGLQEVIEHRNVGYGTNRQIEDFVWWYNDEFADTLKFSGQHYRGHSVPYFKLTSELDGTEFITNLDGFSTMVLNSSWNQGVFSGRFHLAGRSGVNFLVPVV